MKRSIVKVWLFIMSLFAFQASATHAIAFNSEQFSQLKQSHADQQWLIMLWSVDCPPCFKELALIEKIREQHAPNKPLNVVVINTDGDTEANEYSEEVITRFGLTDVPRYFFEEGTAASNRYIIDPSWYGELPRNYFVDRNGKFHGQSGLINADMIKNWLL